MSGVALFGCGTVLPTPLPACVRNDDPTGWIVALDGCSTACWLRVCWLDTGGKLWPEVSFLQPNSFISSVYSTGLSFLYICYTYYLDSNYTRFYIGNIEYRDKDLHVVEERREENWGDPCTRAWQGSPGHSHSS